MLKKISTIKTKYGIDSYVGVSGDRYLNNISSNLRKLWYSSEDMSISNIDIYYFRIFDLSYPDYNSEAFEEDANRLFDALAKEFALLIKSKSTERRTEI